MTKHLSSLIRILIPLIILCVTTVLQATEIIIDSDITLPEAVAGSTAPQNIIAAQVLLNVEYYSFDGKLHRGQLVVHKDLQQDVVAIFELIKQEKFPVAKVVPIVKYGWSDSKSMADNNTSGFNYRVVAGTKRLSNHALGRAIDINPVQNPYKDSKHISPEGSKYDINAAGTLTKENAITKKFLELGWKWGGFYKSIKD